MCTGLDPDFNLWQQLAPFARKLVEEEAVSGLDYWLDQLGTLLQTLLALPGQASRVLAQAEGSGLRVQAPEISRDMRSLTRSMDRLTGSIVFAALMIGGIIMVNAGNNTFGSGLLGASGIALLWILLGGKGK
jgi:predicted unusual protein kinase regulating ubiquinone biosynthesis (AarF/ABC1/UbiB family)